jgi:ribose transport system ATP-binding protein
MLSVEHISKQFSGVVVLDDVSMEFQAGKVNALIGENGAGKSTLMNILSGVYSDYEGQIVLKNQSVHFSNPKEAEEHGIAIIHQELNLVSYLSVRENIFLGREVVNKLGMLNVKEMRIRTQRILEQLNLDVHPDTFIYKLKVGQQQVVEIAKALMLESEVIIMDEPTSAISDNEVEVLFKIIENLKKENRTIVYISHKLDELFQIAERYSVLRDGKFIESGDIEKINQQYLISRMVGREIKIVKKESKEDKNDEVLSVRKLHLKNPVKNQDDLLRNISFNVQRGEVVGLFGLMGAGRTELLETIFGLNVGLFSGEIQINQQCVNFKSPSDAIEAGVALVPEDRKKDGLVLGLDVKTNISITSLKKIEKFGFLNDLKEKELSKNFIEELQIKTSSQKQLVRNLSGGNQQKIVLAKWLAINPNVLLLDEPTRGIDINAKNEIYKLIYKLADAGLGILMVSSEMPEILAIPDRVLVMSEGRMTADLNINEATEDNILTAAIPKSI